MRGITFLPFLALAHTCACEQPPLCDNEEKLVDAFIYVEDGVIRAQSLDGWGPEGEYGTLDDSPMAECRGSTLNIDISGEISSLAVFDRFEVVGGELAINGEGGTDIVGFDALASTGALSVGVFNSLDGFNGLRETGALWIGAGDVLGLRALHTVRGPVYFSLATSIPGRTALRTAGSIESNSGTVIDLSPLISLVEVTGDVILLQTPIEILGMDSLVEIGGNLRIQLAGFPLTAWNGFASMDRIGGDLLVRGNNSLPSAQVHEWLIDVDVAGSTTVCENLGGAADICPPTETAEF